MGAGRRERGNGRTIALLISLAALVAFAVVPAMLVFDTEVEARRGTVVPAPDENEGDSPARTVAAVDTARPAIATAVRWLESQQRADGSFLSPDYDRPGATAMVCWILLEATQEAQRPAVTRGLAWLREHADPERAASSGQVYGTYDAACTLVALFHHYRCASEPETAARIRAAVTPADRALIGRLAAYVRACADAKGWRYRADDGAVRVAAAPAPSAPSAPEEENAAALRDAGAVSRLPKHHRIYWGGDNSNGGYGWMALRAASLLGVRAANDEFVTGEFERMLATRITTGERRTVRVTRRVDGQPRGFAGFWPAGAWEAETHLGGWSYAHGQQVPAMTASTIASLVYCWQEAHEREVLDDATRRRAAAAVLGGLGSLRGAASPDVFCLY